jgi:ABC-type multidrug transport system ATPase subunit
MPAQLVVSSLSYDPALTLGDVYRDNVEGCFPRWSYPLKSMAAEYLSGVSGRLQEGGSVAPLRNVTFTAPAGKVTAIMSNVYGERRTLIDLIAGRRKRGAFDGHVLLAGVGGKGYAKDHTAFVPRKVNFIPGLTFQQTLRYSAELRMTHDRNATEQDRARAVDERVDEVLSLMSLKHCAGRMLTADDDSADAAYARGEPGSDLRRLSIAVEIVNLPSLVIVDDPQMFLDPGVALGIFGSLKTLALMGRIVLVSIPKPSPVLLAHIDSIVLLAEGYSIYASAPHNLVSYFSSSKMGYVFNKDKDREKGEPPTDLMEWVLDIAAGTERPTTQRIADDPAIQQEKFESSALFKRPHAGSEALSVFPEEMFSLWGYRLTTQEPPLALLRRVRVVLQRCLHVKTKEYAAIKTGLGGSILVALLVGYLQFAVGSYGQYTMSLIFYPYVNTSNVTALLFFVCAFPFTQQVMAVQFVCRKVANFRHEQQAGACPSLTFAVATFLSEAPFVLFYGFVFATIVYFMSALNVGLGNYCFFVQELSLFALIGYLTAFLFAVLLREEILVRDTFLCCLFMMLMLSGFPFQLSTIRSDIADVSVLNPMRWALASLMSWKFGAAYYKDGDQYLKPYNFQDFPHTNVFYIFGNFIAFSLSLSTLLLLPRPNFLRRSRASKRSRRSLAYSFDGANSDGDVADGGSSSSFGSGGGGGGSARGSFDIIYARTRTQDLTKPLIFTRESSLTGSQRLSINLSQSGGGDLGDDTLDAGRGPTVSFSNVTYRVKRRTAAAGHKTILDRVSGRFDWGKLGCILGAPRSGKSSLLHILAGDAGIRSEVTGDVLYDGVAVPVNVPLWQRCALVDCKDEHLSSLTVKEVVTYAMELRCSSVKMLSRVAENIGRTLDILHLTDVGDKRVKCLSAGERRRLSIAEEIVHGPSLLLIDEPETELSALDCSVLYRTFREMVNQERTVIAAVSQPSASVFSLFDTLVLLSGGRVIYQGRASAAVGFFQQSPFGFSFKGYNNAGDFLTDVSGGFLADSKGRIVGSEDLGAHYKTTQEFKAVSQQLYAGAKGPGRLGSGRSEEVASLLSAASPPPSAPHQPEGELEEPAPLGYFYLYPIVLHNLGVFFRGWATWLSSRQRREAVSIQLSVLLRRAAWALLKRRSILLGTIVAHILLACILGLIVGNSSASIYNTTSFFAVGTLLLVLGNVQLISYLFQVHQVFLKEQTRGLYSSASYWAVGSLPLYLLRAVNAVVYAFIAYNLLCLSQGAPPFLPCAPLLSSPLPSLVLLLCSPLFSSSSSSSSPHLLCSQRAV